MGAEASVKLSWKEHELSCYDVVTVVTVVTVVNCLDKNVVKRECNYDFQSY